VPFVFTKPDSGGRKQLPDSALLVDMQYPSSSVALDLYTEEAAN